MIIGIGNLPASYDGALMADLAINGTLTPEYTLDEQGVADILRLADGSLIVCGCDASLGDDWQLGNIYIRSNTGVWTKKRTLENVIHVWGACLHNGSLYVATGAHIGDNATWEARVYISDDLGDTWTHQYVCYYRIYDIISFNGLLYATAWDYPYYRLYVSNDDGVTWNIVPGVTPEARIRMVEFDGHLVGVNSGGESLWVIDSLGVVSSAAWPVDGGLVHQYNFNSLVVASGALYVLATSKIWKLDFIGGTWTYHCNLETDCVAIGDMDGVGLIVSTTDIDAKLLKVNY